MYIINYLIKRQQSNFARKKYYFAMNGVLFPSA